MNYAGRLSVEPDNRLERIRTPDPDPFGLLALVKTLRRRFVVIASVGGIAGFIVLAMAFLQTPRYAASAQIMLDPRQERVVTPQQEIVTDLPSTNMTVVDSEIEVLRSRRLAERVVNDLNLVEDPNWNPFLRPPSRSERILAPLREALGRPARRPSAPPAGYEERLKEAITDRVWASNRVRRRGMTYAIDVGAISTDPRSAARLANGMVAAYLALQVEDRLATAERANAWLTQRLGELRADVEAKERAVEEYRAQTGLLNAQGSSLSEAQMSEVQGNVLTARADLAERRARYRQIQELQRQGVSPDSTADVLTSSTMIDLRQRQAQARHRIAEMRQRYRPEHPELVEAIAASEDLDRQVAVEINRVAASLRNELEVAQSRVGALEGSLRGARGELVTNNAALVRLRELEREAAASQEVYEGYLRRLEEITAQDRLNTTNARVVSEARPPRGPYSPNLRIALVMAIVIGLAAGIAVAVLLEMLDQTVNASDRIEEKLGLPTIASVPALTKRHLRFLAPGDQNPAGYLVEKPMSAFAEAFRVLRTSIVYSDPDRRHRVVAITSAMPDEGKTTTALCLGRISATAGERVIIVDCDLRRHSLNEALDITPANGLLQVLAGEKTLSECIVEDEHTSVHILPIAETAFSPRDIFGSEAMRNLVEELRSEYDLVVFDCPPLLAVADARIIAAMSDITLIVARWGKTQMWALRDAVHQALETGADVIGIALNRVNPKTGRTSYNDALYYYKGNKNYYTT